MEFEYRRQFQVVYACISRAQLLIFCIHSHLALEKPKYVNLLGSIPLLEVHNRSDVANAIGYAMLCMCSKAFPTDI